MRSGWALFSFLCLLACSVEALVCFVGMLLSLDGLLAYLAGRLFSLTRILSCFLETLFSCRETYLIP